MVGKCKFCGQDKPLIRAHVIPEAFYKELYDSSHSFVEVETSTKKSTRRRKGLYDPQILCRKCDSDLFGKRYDDYASKAFYGYRNKDLGIVDYHSDKDDRVRWRVAKNVDSGRIKLFFLSLLWRADISNLPMFENVNLGSKHREKIKKMILDNNPGGTDEYPIILIHYSINDPKSRMFISKIMRYRKNGKYYYAFILSGILVIWYISENQVPLPLLDYTVSKDNELCIIFSPTQGYDFIARMTGEEAFRHM